MFTQQKKLPELEHVLETCPLDSKLNELKLRFDEQIRENFVSRKRFTVVCGPCSADDPKAMSEYLRKLKSLQASYPNLLIVARVYSTKPHSNGQGYKGTCFHEKIDDDVDMVQGINRARRIMINCLEIGLPIADELLYPELYPYFSDLVSYWFIGARSSEDSLHRSFASGIDVCCGVKNGTDGDILKVVDSLNAVAKPCVFPYAGFQMATNGCKYSHIVLRGGKLGEGFVDNLFPEYTRLAKERLRSLGLNDYIMADLSHANSLKMPLNQIVNAVNVSRNHDIDGAMIESYIYGGINDNLYGVSKTDDCLSFNDTVKVLKILEQGFCKASKK